MSYRYSRGTDWFLVFTLAMFLIFVVGVGTYYIIKLSYRVDQHAALARFEELTQSKNVVIVRHTNDTLLFGDPYDITYELMVDGRLLSGRCTTAAFSEMVCRVYSAGGD